MLALTWDRIDTARRVAYLPVTKNGFHLVAYH